MQTTYTCVSPVALLAANPGFVPTEKLETGAYSSHSHTIIGGWADAIVQVHNDDRVSKANLAICTHMTSTQIWSMLENRTPRADRTNSRLYQASQSQVQGQQAIGILRAAHSLNAFCWKCIYSANQRSMNSKVVSILRISLIGRVPIAELNDGPFPAPGPLPRALLTSFVRCLSQLLIQPLGQTNNCIPFAGPQGENFDI